jgi:hypothetical protein
MAKHLATLRWFASSFIGRRRDRPESAAGNLPKDGHTRASDPE